MSTEILLHMQINEAISMAPCDLTKIDDKIKCPLCKNILTNVHQADDCGCRFCQSCLKEM